MPTPSLLSTTPTPNVGSLDGPRDWLRSVPRRLRGPGRRRGALLLLTAALIAGLTVFGGGTVQADPVTGEVTNLRLSSDAPGELTITWDAPSDAPADYRVAWARADLSYLSWDASDETHRGNSYPGSADTSLTLSGLTGGETYKVRMRSRYNPGTADGWSGPWTGEVTVTVSSPPPTPVPTAVPTAVPSPVPASDEVSNLRLSSDAPGELTITWDAPSDVPADYRVAWARDDLSYLSWDASDETHRGSSYPGGADTSLTLTGLTGGETYRARMRSRYNPGTSDGRSGPWTDEATQRVSGDAPAAPTALSAEETTIKGQTSIALSWTAPSHDALTGYRIWRGADADSLTALVQDTGDTATGYNDTTTETGNTYVYAVTALSLDGDSPRSATASVTGARSPRDEPTPEPAPQPGEISELTLSSDARGTLEMEWTAADPAPDRYWINWGESHLEFPSLEDRDFNFAWTGTDMFFGDSIVDAGKTYQVRVRAVYDADEDEDEAAWNGSWLDTALQRVRSDPPPAPGALTVGVVDHDGVSLSWSAPTHDALTGYRVLRGASASSLDTLAELGVDARSYTDTATDGATTYHYAVVALSQDGDSPRSSSVTATTPPRTPMTPVVAGAPAAPEGLSGTLDGNGGVTLGWTDPGDSAITGYRVLRGDDARSLVIIAEDTGSAAVSYTDAAPAANATHVYAVQARNATGLSQLSATFSATTLNPPFGLAADAGAFDVTLTWRAPDGDGITGYQVLRGAGAAAEMTVIADDTGSTATSYVDATISPETSYYYAVHARSAQGLGPASPAHLVTTSAAASFVFLDDDNLVSQQQQGSHVLVSPNPPPNLVGVGFVVLQDVFVVDSASHMLRLGRKEGFGRRF